MADLSDGHRLLRCTCLLQEKKSLEDAASPRRSLPMQLKYSSLPLPLRRFSSFSSILFDLI